MPIGRDDTSIKSVIAKLLTHVLAFAVDRKKYSNPDKLFLNTKYTCLVLKGNEYPTFIPFIFMFKLFPILLNVELNNSNLYPKLLSISV